MSVSALRIFIYSAVVIFNITLFIICFRARKNVRTALSFAYLSLWISMIVAGNITGQLVHFQGYSDAQIWLKFSFSGLLLAAPALVIFILLHLRTAIGARLIFRLLLHLPAVVLVPLVFTNDVHRLFWNPDLDFSHPSFFGLLYYPALLLSAAFALAALGLLIERFQKTERIYHLQFSLFLAAILVPVLTNLFIALFKLPVIESLDLSIAAWTLMQIVSAFALLRLPLFGMLPIAQSELLRHVRDGFLITNPHHEVIFINPAAQDALQVTGKDALGKPLNQLIGAKTKRIIINTEKEHTSFELQVGDHYYNVNISNIKSRRQHDIGQIAMIYDVTDQTEFANQFREQARKDDLTNVYNRRYLLEQAHIEFERARRYRLPFSIIMIDIDGLKMINDQHGHITGDIAIQTFSDTCQGALRGSDTIGRFGGDEFVILLPHTGPAKAVSILNRLTSKLEKSQINTDSGMLRISASFGVTSLNRDTDTSLNDMIKRADQALYQAKSDPKNSWAEVQSPEPHKNPFS